MKSGAVIGGVALAVLASLPAALPALAADMSPIAPRPAVSSYIPAQFFWTGFYMGVGIGGSWDRVTFIDPLPQTPPAAFAPTGSLTPKGFLVTGISGINYQIGSVVIGAEADFTGTWAKGSVVDAFADTLSTSVFWTATVTGRVGMAFDRVLVYGKGGVAFDYDRDTAMYPNGNTAVGSLYRVGWTVGGGVEYAVTDHWTGRLEYDYLAFPSKGLTLQGNATTPPNVGFVSSTIGVNISEIKLIMSYKM
jgi:outer membrane immunogenic protein